MNTLFQALQDLRFFLEPSIRVPRVVLQYDPYDAIDGKLHVFTGTLYGERRVGRITEQEWCVDADRLRAVLREDSRLRVNDARTQLIVRNDRSTFRLPLILDKDSIMQGGPLCNDFDWLQLSNGDVAAIKLAAKFASTNQMHPWASSVTLFVGHAVATNNMSLVCVRLPSCTTHDFVEPVTIPFWLFDVLEEGVRISWDDSKIYIITTAGVQGYGACLQESPPPMVLDMALKLKEDKCDWMSIEPWRQAYEALKVMPGRHFTLESTRIVTESEDGSSGECSLEHDRDLPKVYISKEMSELIFESADELSFSEARRLKFRRADPKMYGVSVTIAVMGEGGM